MLTVTVRTFQTGYYLKPDLLNSGFSVPDSFSSYYSSFECDCKRCILIRSVCDHLRSSRFWQSHK